MNANARSRRSGSARFAVYTIGGRAVPLARLGSAGVTVASGHPSERLGLRPSKLLPYLKGLENQDGATPRQKVISEVMSGVERSKSSAQLQDCKRIFKSG